MIDPILVDAAREGGAEVRHGVALTAIERTAAGRVAGVVIADRSGATRTVGTDLVIGADGRRSTVAGLVGAATYRSGRHRTAAVYTYVPGLPNDGFIWCYRVGASVGVIPTNSGEHCVFASMPPDRFRTQVQPDLAAGLRAYRRGVLSCSGAGRQRRATVRADISASLASPAISGNPSGRAGRSSATPATSRTRSPPTA